MAKHGMARAGKKRAPEYSIWSEMIQRCINPKNKRYRDYGARGITVCEEWLQFINFYEDMGKRPPGMTLERIDNDRGYCEDNCEWASCAAQSINKRNNVWIKIDQQEYLLRDALKLMDVSMAGYRYHINTYKISPQEVFDLWIKQKRLLDEWLEQRKARSKIA